MSAYSTLDISRAKARQVLMKAVMEADDEVLGEMLDTVLRDRLYNVRVVDNSAPNDDALVRE